MLSLLALSMMCSLKGIVLSYFPQYVLQTLHFFVIRIKIFNPDHMHFSFIAVKLQMLTVWEYCATWGKCRNRG